MTVLFVKYCYLYRRLQLVHKTLRFFIHMSLMFFSGLGSHFDHGHDYCFVCCTFHKCLFCLAKSFIISCSSFKIVNRFLLLSILSGNLYLILVNLLVIFLKSVICFKVICFVLLNVRNHEISKVKETVMCRCSGFRQFVSKSKHANRRKNNCRSFAEGFVIIKGIPDCSSKFECHARCSQNSS